MHDCATSGTSVCERAPPRARSPPRHAPSRHRHRHRPHRHRVRFSLNPRISALEHSPSLPVAHQCFACRNPSQPTPSLRDGRDLRRAEVGGRQWSSACSTFATKSDPARHSASQRLHPLLHPDRSPSHLHVTWPSAFRRQAPPSVRTFIGRRRRPLPEDLTSVFAIRQAHYRCDLLDGYRLHRRQSYWFVLRGRETDSVDAVSGSGSDRWLKLCPELDRVLHRRRGGALESTKPSCKPPRSACRRSATVRNRTSFVTGASSNGSSTIQALGKRLARGEGGRRSLEGASSCGTGVIVALSGL